MERLDKEMPLVSIIVITYNSSKYVLETLESTKAQTYQNIELIISDDASQDDTIEICKNWLINNQERFVRTELLTVDKNSGISANCNRGIKTTKGLWIKLIAGDDILVDSNIQDNIDFINKSKNYKLVISKSVIFNNKDGMFNYLKTIPCDVSHEFYSFRCSAEKQFNILKYNNKVNSPTFFFRRDIINEVDYYDENFKNIEDYPMWLKLTKNNHKIYFLDKVTVYYRSHDTNIYQGKNNYLYNYFYFDIVNIKLKYCKEYYSIISLFFMKYQFLIRKLLKQIKLNKPNIFCKVVDRFLTLSFLKECIKF